MTAEEKGELFGRLVRLLDSDQSGERGTALEKLVALREKMGWPSFGDLLRKLESTVTPEQHQQLERDLAQWMQAHAARVAENAHLSNRNTFLAARNASLRSALFFSLNWKRLTVASLALALMLAFGLRERAKSAVPDEQPRTDTVAQKDDSAALDEASLSLLSDWPWVAGDTRPAIFTMDGVPYWLVVRGTIDDKSHADTGGRPIKRHCLQIFASKAVEDQGAYLAPEPYALWGQWMRWPQRAAACRMPESPRAKEEASQ
jgi:hypothetical protein